MTGTPVVEVQDYRIVTKARLEGNAQRWRRFGEPVPAGNSLKDDGTVDFGLFGPGSVVWEVLLHPATIVFQFAFQGLFQSLYKPVVAGVRDHDPLTRKARAGTVTFFDLFERGQRNSGMHAPMWLGDTASAERMWKHLKQYHQKVAGPVISVDEPELGGYEAAGPRDAMWAALTEMHSMLWLYETFAFRDGKFPHKLSPEKRDQYFAEAAAYCKLVGANEDEIPHSKADMDVLYEKYADLFGNDRGVNTWPDNGEDYGETMAAVFKKNFHRSQIPALFYAGILDHGLFRNLAAGGSSGKLRALMGLNPKQSRRKVIRLKLSLPFIWFMQRGPFERHYMRLMWGPDGVALIRSARALETQVTGKKFRKA